MPPTFDLINSPWIPVFDLRTGAAEEVGLHDALIRAHEITLHRPDQEGVALLRLLLAMYDAAAGPTTTQEWDTVWSTPTLDTDRITQYLTAWRHRLDLFDTDRPAFQCGHITAYSRGPEVLDPAYLGGDAGAFFNPQLAHPRPAAPNVAARWLLVLLGYDVSGIKGAPGGGRTYGAHVGPIAAVTHLHLQGHSLKDTLLLNLPPQPREPGDAPVWERDCPELGVVERAPTGRLDLLTWPSRRIRLEPDAAGHVVKVAWHDGARLAGGWKTAHAYDPVSVWGVDRAGGPKPLPITSGTSGEATPWIAAQLLAQPDGDPVLPPANCAAFTHTREAAQREVIPAGYRLRAAAGSVSYSTVHRSVLSDASVHQLDFGTVRAVTDQRSVVELVRAAEHVYRRTARMRWALRTAKRQLPANGLHLSRPWRLFLNAVLDDGDLPAAREEWRWSVDEALIQMIGGLSLPFMDRARVEGVFERRPK